MVWKVSKMGMRKSIPGISQSTVIRCSNLTSAWFTDAPFSL
jgi:hypothetical protein